MKESAQLALRYVQSHAAELGIELSGQAREAKHLCVQRKAVPANAAQLTLGLMAVLLGNDEQSAAEASIHSVLDSRHDRRSFARAGLA